MLSTLKTGEKEASGHSITRNPGIFTAQRAISALWAVLHPAKSPEAGQSRSFPGASAPATW